MFFKVLNVPLNQRSVALQNLQVLSVLFLGCFCKVERARNQRCPVDDDNLIVRYGVRCIDGNRNTGMSDKVSFGVLFRALAFVEYSNDLHPSFLRINESLGNWR